MGIQDCFDKVMKLLDSKPEILSSKLAEVLLRHSIDKLSAMLDQESPVEWN